MKHIEKIESIDITKETPIYDSLLMECLWTHKQQSITESEHFLDQYGNTFFNRLHYSDIGILKTKEKIGLSYIPKIHPLTEEDIIQLIKSYSLDYPDLTITSLATVLVNKYTDVLDQFSIKEEVAIFAYLMNESKKNIEKKFPHIDIQKCVDSLWMRILQIYRPIEIEI